MEKLAHIIRVQSLLHNSKGIIHIQCEGVSWSTTSATLVMKTDRVSSHLTLGSLAIWKTDAVPSLPNYSTARTERDNQIPSSEG